MRKFVNYSEVMKVLGLSTHPNHIASRSHKYPNHFVEIDGEACISEEYVDALFKYRDALQSLERLKKEVGNGNI